MVDLEDAISCVLVKECVTSVFPICDGVTKARLYRFNLIGCVDNS